MSESLNLYCGKCKHFVPDGKNNHSYCGINKFGVKTTSEACFYYAGPFNTQGKSNDH